MCIKQEIIPLFDDLETQLNNEGLLQHHKEIVEYFNTRGVSTIFLFRRNLLRRMISILANSYDRDAKPLNGTHKSHVHSPHEAAILASYKPVINATTLIPSLRQVEETTKKGLEYFKSTRHIILYYEDVVKNHTKLAEVQEFLKVPKRELKSRQIIGSKAVALMYIPFLTHFHSSFVSDLQVTGTNSEPTKLNSVRILVDIALTENCCIYAQSKEKLAFLRCIC
ncbi:hypothetical protein Goklo_007331 [Gossypium klotzschianum]|uniref:Sulfotransferase n=1 Tax=Gossypium klotzschianum TaxID=34286 RepID=A0A7J8W4I6_9ROSI|nr:hypothetical protein [Gossypium klotzschianum]